MPRKDGVLKLREASRLQKRSKRGVNPDLISRKNPSTHLHRRVYDAETHLHFVDAGEVRTVVPGGPRDDGCCQPLPAHDGAHSSPQRSRRRADCPGGALRNVRVARNYAADGVDEERGRYRRARVDTPGAQRRAERLEEGATMHKSREQVRICAVNVSPVYGVGAGVQKLVQKLPDRRQPSCTFRVAPGHSMLVTINARNDKGSRQRQGRKPCARASKRGSNRRGGDFEPHIGISGARVKINQLVHLSGRKSRRGAGRGLGKNYALVKRRNTMKRGKRGG